MTDSEIKTFLDKKVLQYNTPAFIENDPIQIPHQFSDKEDIEIAAFLASSIAWGNRKMIISSAQKMMELTDYAPADFIRNAEDSDLSGCLKFNYRTFQGIDLWGFLKSLQNIYQNHGGLENIFTEGFRETGTIQNALIYFRQIFFETEHADRTEKHIANAAKKSAAKRLNMFLMWMIRQDLAGVHFGLWKDIPASALMIPMDVHVSRTARALNLITRKQTDWQTVEELTQKLREFDAKDPTKYDFALFGLGVFEGFGK